MLENQLSRLHSIRRRRLMLTKRALAPREYHNKRLLPRAEPAVELNCVFSLGSVRAIKINWKWLLNEGAVRIYGPSQRLMGRGGALLWVMEREILRPPLLFLVYLEAFLCWQCELEFGVWLWIHLLSRWEVDLLCQAHALRLGFRK